MTWLEITTLTAGIFHIVLATFVLTRDWRSAGNRVYFLWGMSLTVWNLCVFAGLRTQQYQAESLGFVAVQFLHLALVFLPLSSFHLCLIITRLARPRLLKFLYGLHFLFALSVFTPFYIKGIKPSFLGYYAIGGPISYAFVADLAVLSTVTIGLLYRRQRTLPPFHRASLRALLLGYVILALAGINDLGPLLDLEHYPGTLIRIQPVANLASLFFGIIVSYAVLHHQLLDIRLTLGRLAAQLVRLSYMFLTSFLLLLVLKAIAPSQLPTFAFFSSLGVLLITALAASFLFPRFFGKGEERLERWILGDRFEYQDQIRGFMQRIPSYARAELLFNDLHDLLVKTIGISRYQIILLDESERTFSLFRAHPPCSPTKIPQLTVDSPIIRCFLETEAEYLNHTSAYDMPGETALVQAARRQLQEFEFDLCFPFVFGKGPFGLLLIGGKTHDQPYTTYDLQVLVELVNNLRLILSQIRLANQVLLTEEMELLGRMSGGMAHDLNNLLTPVWTYLQLARELPQDKDGLVELLPNALRNVQTIQAYIKEALFLSQNHKPQIRPGRLNLLIQKTVELADARLQRKNVAAQIQPLAETIIEMDDVLMQRLIGNLLANAIDASPAAGVVRIELDRLPQNDASRDWFRLRIMDQGEGISPENLKRIATPYFTTKDRGDEGRGFGLGLAICRNIVRLHGGKLSIASEEKKGTTVQVDLPSRQINHNNQEPSIVTAKP